MPFDDVRMVERVMQRGLLHELHTPHLHHLRRGVLGAELERHARPAPHSLVDGAKEASPKLGAEHEVGWGDDGSARLGVEESVELERLRHTRRESVHHIGRHTALLPAGTYPPLGVGFVFCGEEARERGNRQCARRRRRGAVRGELPHVRHAGRVRAPQLRPLQRQREQRVKGMQLCVHVESRAVGARRLTHLDPSTTP